MKNNIYFLIRSFLISLLSFLLIPFISFAQGLAPIPDVGPGVCVSNCGTPSISHTPTPTPDENTIPITFPTSAPSVSPAPSSTPQAIVTQLQTSIELDNQALQKLKEKNYASVPPIINNAIESLTNVRDSLKTDPALKKVCRNKPKAISLINRSINDHEKALSSIEDINNAPKTSEEEGLISKLVSSAKKFIKRAITRTHRVSTVGAICGVRG